MEVFVFCILSKFLSAMLAKFFKIYVSTTISHAIFMFDIYDINKILKLDLWRDAEAQNFINCIKHFGKKLRPKALVNYFIILGLTDGICAITLKVNLHSIRFLSVFVLFFTFLLLLEKV